MRCKSILVDLHFLGLFFMEWRVEVQEKKITLLLNEEVKSPTNHSISSDL